MMDMTPTQVRKRRPEDIAYPKLKAQRDQLRAEGRCINGPRDPNAVRGQSRGVEHGPVVRGGKCQRCWDIAKAGRGGKKKAT